MKAEFWLKIKVEITGKGLNREQVAKIKKTFMKEIKIDETGTYGEDDNIIAHYAVIEVKDAKERSSF